LFKLGIKISGHIRSQVASQGTLLFIPDSKTDLGCVTTSNFEGRVTDFW